MWTAVRGATLTWGVPCRVLVDRKFSLGLKYGSCLRSQRWYILRRTCSGAASVVIPTKPSHEYFPHTVPQGGGTTDPGGTSVSLRRPRLKDTQTQTHLCMDVGTYLYIFIYMKTDLLDRFKFRLE